MRRPSPPADDPSAVETAPETEARVDGPEKTDLGGYELKIVTSTWFNNDGIIHPEELTGEVINDAVYNANLGVAETYNCGFAPIILDTYPAVTQAVELAVKSGMDEYDLSYNHDNQTVANAMKGYFLNIRGSDVFNFDAPWWTKTAEDFTVGGGLYFAANYVTYSPLYFGFTLVYNKDIAANYGIEIPYDRIFAGDWYLEDFIAMTKDTNQDLDGDGEMTVGRDQYGFMASSLGLVNFQVSLGISVLGKDEEGYLTFSVDQERLSKALDMIGRLMENGINKDDVPGEPWGYGTSHFADGQVLFNYPQIVDIPAQMHDTDVRFGTLPPPKLDENQKDYISGCFDVYWAIPKTAYERVDTIATIVEGMGHNCYYDVLPAAYETTLQVRFSDSPNDARAFEIIRDSMCVDVGYAFNEHCTALSGIVRAFSTMTSGTMASEIAKNETMLKKQLSKTNDKIRKMNEEWARP
ncbi:MAG: hypothetical protein E7576_08380 [Ruminococcaceae bacterium]|nr:hypothetical protein [Oscillospiraceae bacterium]